MKSILAALALLLSFGDASAYVAYEWETLSNPFDKNYPFVKPYGSIVLLDDNLDVTYHVTETCGPSTGALCLPDTNTSLVSFQFAYELIVPLQPPWAVWRENSVQIHLVANEWLLDGHIHLQREFTDLRMSSNNGLWTIGYLNGDWLPDCFNYGPAGCGGQTGRWVRVSEPGMVTLLTIGLVGLAGVRRKFVYCQTLAIVN